jgi:hypothetical protein
LFGRRDDLTSNVDRLIGLGELGFYNGGLVFREENQAVMWWGVLEADLDQLDPPVAMRYDMADKSTEEWEGWLPSFSLSCVEIVLSESLQWEDDHQGPGRDMITIR